MTKTSKQHWGFKLWVKIRGFVALCVVLLGILVGLATLLLPFDSLYKKRLELFLQQQWNMQVSVNEIVGSWKGFGPHFQLKGLKLEGKQTVEVADTTLSLNVYELVIPGGKTGINLSISQADLAMVQSEKGHNITINNDRDEAKFIETLDNILTTGVLSVSELNLNVANGQGETLLSGLKAAFVLEQDNVNRAMSLDVRRGDQSVLFLKSIGPRSKQLSKDAAWHVMLNKFDVSQFNELQTGWNLPSFILDGEVWINSIDGVMIDARAEVEWKLGDLNGLLTWQHEGENKQWRSRFKLSDLLSESSEYPDISGQIERQGEFITAVTDDVDLSWLNLLLSHQIEQWPTLKLNGTVSDLRLEYDFLGKQFDHASGQFVINDVLHEKFTLNQLAGEVIWHNEVLEIMVDAQDGFFEMPSFIRGKMQWKHMLSQISVPFTDEKNSIKVNQFWCDCKDFVADAQGQYWLTNNEGAQGVDALGNLAEPAQQKMMQLQAKVASVDVAALRDYWPHNVWKPKTIDYLDKSLKSGNVSTGYLFQFGQLIPKAFEDHLAFFESRAYLEDVSINYNPEWPVANDVDGIAMFTGLGFSADISNAQSMGIRMNSAHVSMDSYKQDFVGLSVKASSQGNAIFDYLSQTPIIQKMPLDENMSMSGRQHVSLSLDIPLKKETKVIPKGQVQFIDAGFNTQHLNLTHLNGGVQLDGFDLKLTELSAQLMSHEVEISGDISTQTESGLQLDVQLKGDMTAEQLMLQQQINLPISGLSEWLINISNSDKQLHMKMSSNLLGTTIDLPAPLNKSANNSKPFELDCDIPCANSNIQLNYGDEIISHLVTTDKGLVINKLQFKEAIDSVDDGLVLGGHISQLDVDNWLGQVKNWSQQEDSNQSHNPWPLPEKAFTLDVDEMLFLARRFYDVKLDVVRLEDAYQVDIDNESMKGRLLVADDLINKGVVADFEYLHWKEATIDDLTQSSQSTEKFPDLHIFSKTFSYLGMPFGELRLEMRNVIDGMRVETMSLVSETSKIQISGDWVASKGAGNELGMSDFSIVMTSEKIATFLKQMDFDAPITDAQTLIQLYASWPGTPSMFDLKNINGTLNLKMGEGEVLDTKPGFGRVLGLFSLTNLPRRLILDFKDVMAEGLHFDSMEGQFVLNNGYAETDDFLIKASAADITVKGLTGFADKSYQQIILVEPQVGKTFPTLGAIAGGAVGAAAGFFVQGLLNKKLQSKNRITYQVTGSWDEPIIEVIEDE